MISQETIKFFYEKAVAFSCPPIIINEGTKTESLYYENKKLHDWILDNYSFEEIIYKVCGKDRDLCNAVYDYAYEIYEIVD